MLLSYLCLFSLLFVYQLPCMYVCTLKLYMYSYVGLTEHTRVHSHIHMHSYLHISNIYDHNHAHYKIDRNTRIAPTKPTSSSLN